MDKLFENSPIKTTWTEENANNQTQEKGIADASTFVVVCDFPHNMADKDNKCQEWAKNEEKKDEGVHLK